MPEFFELEAAFKQIRTELAKVTVGQEEFLEQLVIALLSGGHCLIEGPPGVGQTLTARSLATVCDLDFERIRCTPDLTPTDLVGPVPTGSPNIASEPVLGPLFAHLVLVDDADQMSPKSFSVIQQAVEGQAPVVHGHRFQLPEPHLVLCKSYVDTEHFEHPPKPQDDRFLFKLRVGYPSAEVEQQLADLMTRPRHQPLAPQLNAERLLEFRNDVMEITAAPHLIDYAVRLIRATRVHEGDTPDFAYEWISSGAGPRATHHLVIAAKVKAALRGATAVNAEDVRQIAPAVLRHRIVTNRNAQNNGVTVDQVIDRLIYEIAEQESNG